MLPPELSVLGDIMLAIPTTMPFPEMLQDLPAPYLSVADRTLRDSFSGFVEVVAGVWMRTLLHVRSVLGTPVNFW